MNILITGASGLIGRHLVYRLQQQNHKILALTRNPDRARKILGDKVTLWQSLQSQTTLDGISAVINLAGEPIAARRWTTKGKHILCQSRWQITEQLTNLINTRQITPSVFISASAIGYYGDLGQQEITEYTDAHPEFTHHLCQHWEQLALDASAHTRVCLLRTGVVLSRDGGMLPRLLPLFRAGLGGHMGQGSQYLSWIHLHDQINAILWLLEHPCNGSFNLVAPNPVTNREFTRILGQTLHRPACLHIPGWLLRILAGESSTLILASQRVIPQRLSESGFQFQYPTLNIALAHLLTYPLAK